MAPLENPLPAHVLPPLDSAGRAFAPARKIQRYIHAEEQLKDQKVDQVTSDKWQYQYQEQEHPGADFDALAEGYDESQRMFRDIQGEIREVLDFLDLKKDQTLLEIGTGTGELALAAAPHCAQGFMPWTCRQECFDTQRRRQHLGVLPTSISSREDS